MTYALRVVFVCPACRGELRRETNALHCEVCGKTYPFEHDIADFAGGAYYDHFDGRAESLTEEHRAGLACSTAAAATVCRSTRSWRSGTTLGASISRRCANGSGASARIAIASPSPTRWRFPFPMSRSTSSCPRAMGGATYTVTPLPGRDALRRMFVAELLRVTRPGGRARFHSRSEGFLPTAAEIRRAVQEVDPHATVRMISPRRRFAFRQVGRHWYGRALRFPAEAFLRVLEMPLLRRAAPWVTPYLVAEVRRGAR